MCKFVNGYINKELDQDLYEISMTNLKNFFFIIDYENYNNECNKLMKKIKPKKKIEYFDNFKINIREIPENEKNIIKKYNYYDLKLFELFKDKLT